ncbi:MAG: hypothetical protein ACREEA_11410 [Stellaceae bacterium]
MIENDETNPITLSPFYAKGGEGPAVRSAPQSPRRRGMESMALRSHPVIFVLAKAPIATVEWSRT